MPKIGGIVRLCYGRYLPSFLQSRKKTGGAFRHEWESDSMPVHEYSGRSRSKTIRVYVWGFAGGGALGVREFLVPKAKNHPRALLWTYVPFRLPFGEEHQVRKVGAGYGFSLFAMNCQNWRKVYGCGLNPFCQLGFHPGKTDSRKSRRWLIDPQPIRLPLKTPETTKILDLFCGRSHSVIVTDREGIFTMGNNSSGQCGRRIIENEDYSATSTVHQVKGIEGKAVKVLCGLDHTLVLTEEGAVYSFGNGADGQLGNGCFEDNWEPQLVGGEIKGEKIVQIAGSSDTVLAVSEKGDVFGWGNSEYQQLAVVAVDAPQVNVPRYLPFRVGKVTSVAAGGSGCSLVTESGELFVWGFGILGQGPAVLARSTPDKIPLEVFGRTEIDNDVLIRKVFAGPMHFAAQTNKGSLYMWGKNRFGLLGLGNEKDQFFPLKVNLNGELLDMACGADHTLALTRALL